MAAIATPSGAPVRVLALDGGGVRGLSELVILEQIMEKINIRREQEDLPPQEPWQAFDMIGGTSTGGLIAIMLGRLRMPIQEAITAYMKLSASAFTEKHLARRVMSGPLGAKFETQPLEDAVKGIIGPDWGSKLLKDTDNACRVFVVTHQTDITNDVEILRSYRNSEKSRGSLDTMLIWQAARATSAAMTFFDPIVIDGMEYRDGGLMYNNPVDQAHAEASEVFPNRTQIVVSLGTGLVTTKAFSPNLATVAQELGKIATETERVHDSFYRRDGSRAARSGRYYRFNVPEIGDKGLAESKQEDLTFLRKKTERYIDNPETGSKLASCTEQLAEGPPLPDPDPHAQELRNELVKWLSAHSNLDFSRIHSQHVLERKEGSGMISSSVEAFFEDWMNDDSDTRWLKGVSGAGKSVFMSSIIEFVKSSLKPKEALVYIYFEQDLSNYDTAQVLVAILKQIVEHQPQLSRNMLDFRLLLTQLKSKALGRSDWRLALQDVVRGYDGIFIFLDALDRGDGTLVAQVISDLNTLMVRPGNVKMLATSLNMPDFGGILKNAKWVDFEPDQDDIKKFLERRLEESPALVRRWISRDPNLKGIIIKAVSEKARGMFLMARLSMDALGASKAQTKNGFLDSLRNLPDTPKDLYRELWARIKDQDEGTFVIAQQIFAWVTYSRRTLTPEELQQGLYFHEHHRPWHDDVSGDLIQPEDVATICLGIICQKSETGVMGFEHHTAEIFFPEFFANEHEGFAPQAQIWIATACLNHIKSTERESTSQRPLDDYAALFWGDHVRNTAHHDDYEALFQDEHVSDSVHLNMDSAVMRFLLDEHCICQAAELFARAARRNGHSPQPAEHIRALHLAAYFGLNSVVARLISDEHVTVDTRAPEPNSWTAIRWAVHNAQEDTVLLLLWKGADLELLYHDGNTLLMVLLGADTQRLQMWPWSTIFETITTTESSKTHFGNTYYWSPGSSARHDPSNDVDRHLYHVLHNSHCIETRNCSGLTALHIAARRGSRSEGAALQLIQTGARIDTKSTDGFTPLLSALQPRRDKKYSKFIIRDQSGCQIGLQHYWDVPLAVLADNKYYEIDRDGPAVSEELIVALTDAKVDLEAKDTWGRTALSYAAACGFRKAVSSLLEARANTETIDHCGRTPLIWSLRRHALHRYLLEDFIITDDARVFISDSVEIDGLRHASVDPRVFSDVSTSRCLIAITLAERTTAVAHRDNGGKSAFDLANDEGLNPLARILKDREQETGGVVVADSPVSLFNCYALDDARVAIGHHIGGVMSLDNVIVSERGRMMIGSVGTRPADAGIATDIPRPMVDFMVRNVIVSGEARLHIEGMQARGGHNQSRIPSRLATATEEWLIHSDGSRERLDFAHFRDTTVEGSYNYE